MVTPNNSDSTPIVPMLPPSAASAIIIALADNVAQVRLTFAKLAALGTLLDYERVFEDEVALAVKIIKRNLETIEAGAPIVLPAQQNEVTQ